LALLGLLAFFKLRGGTSCRECQNQTMHPIPAWQFRSGVRRAPPGNGSRPFPSLGRWC
jgi:hypothetical protein